MRFSPSARRGYPFAAGVGSNLSGADAAHALSNGGRWNVYEQIVNRVVRLSRFGVCFFVLFLLIYTPRSNATLSFSPLLLASLDFVCVCVWWRSLKCGRFKLSYLRTAAFISYSLGTGCGVMPAYAGRYCLSWFPCGCENTSFAVVTQRELAFLTACRLLFTLQIELLKSRT